MIGHNQPRPRLVIATAGLCAFQGPAGFDLELIESRTLDGHIQELIYRPTLAHI